METIFNVIIYIVVGIFLLIIFLKFKKPSNSLKTSTNNSNKVSSPASKFPELAGYLGMKYEDNKAEGNGDLLLNSAERIHGIYDGTYIDINYGGYAKEVKSFNIAYSFSYEYSINKSISFSVKNSGKEFVIMPLNKNIVPNPTGIKEFDKNLFYSGNVTLPKEYLEYFSEMKWMNLHLKDDKILFIDSYYEDISASKGGMAMMTAVHPVFKVSAQNFNSFKFEDFKNFLDKILELINTLELR